MQQGYKFNIPAPIYMIPVSAIPVAQTELASTSITPPVSIPPVSINHSNVTINYFYNQNSERIEESNNSKRNKANRKKKIDPEREKQREEALIKKRDASAFKERYMFKVTDSMQEIEKKVSDLIKSLDDIKAEHLYLFAIGSHTNFLGNLFSTKKMRDSKNEYSEIELLKILIEKIIAEDPKLLMKRVMISNKRKGDYTLIPAYLSIRMPTRNKKYLSKDEIRNDILPLIDKALEAAPELATDKDATGKTISDYKKILEDLSKGKSKKKNARRKRKLEDSEDEFIMPAPKKARAEKPVEAEVLNEAEEWYTTQVGEVGADEENDTALEEQRPITENNDNCDLASQEYVPSLSDLIAVVEAIDKDSFAQSNGGKEQFAQYELLSRLNLSRDAVEYSSQVLFAQGEEGVLNKLHEKLDQSVYEKSANAPHFG